MERLFSHTIGITNRALACDGREPHSGLPARELEKPGSAVAGKWGSSYFILTANHVLENGQLSDLEFFARPSGALESVPEVAMKDARSAMPLNDSQAAIHRCVWEDLALVSLNDTDVFGPYLEFVDVAKSWADPLEGENLFGLGYPVSSGAIFGRQAGTNRQMFVLLRPGPFGGAVLPDSQGAYFKNFVPGKHCLIPYDLAAGGEHPGGISGAALWLRSNTTSTVWAPRFTFAGVCTAAYRNGSIVQVVKASIVRQFLAEVFGNP
jgi:hypothetical protein